MSDCWWQVTGEADWWGQVTGNKLTPSPRFFLQVAQKFSQSSAETSCLSFHLSSYLSSFPFYYSGSFRTSSLVLLNLYVIYLPFLNTNQQLYIFLFFLSVMLFIFLSFTLFNNFLYYSSFFLPHVIYLPFFYSITFHTDIFYASCYLSSFPLCYLTTFHISPVSFFSLSVKQSRLLFTWPHIHI